MGSITINRLSQNLTIASLQYTTQLSIVYLMVKAINH
jgi:hypothetical protein